MGKLRRFLRLRGPVHGPHEPANVYDAYYTWFIGKGWWTLDDFRRYRESGRSIW